MCSSRTHLYYYGVSEYNNRTCSIVCLVYPLSFALVLKNMIILTVNEFGELFQSTLTSRLNFSFKPTPKSDNGVNVNAESENLYRKIFCCKKYTILYVLNLTKKIPIRRSYCESTVNYSAVISKRNEPLCDVLNFIRISLRKLQRSSNKFAKAVITQYLKALVTF